MRTHIFALVAALGLATVGSAGELDREYKGGDAKGSVATTKALPEPATKVSTGTELDDESPTQAHRRGWGWGGGWGRGWGGWGGGWGWGGRGWGWGRGWGVSVGWGGGWGGWGWGGRGWGWGGGWGGYRSYYGVGYWPSYSYYSPAYSLYPSWGYVSYGYPGWGYSYW